jgi:hypothetical protein
VQTLPWHVPPRHSFAAAHASPSASFATQMEAEQYSVAAQVESLAQLGEVSKQNS